MTQRGRDPGPPGRPGGGGRPGPVPSARRPGDARPGERRPDRDRDRGRAERGAARPREVPPPGRDGTRAARTGGAGARGLGDATVRSGYAADKSGSRPSRPKSGGPPRTGPGGPRRPPRRPRRPRQFTVRRGEPGRRLGITLLAIVFVLTIFGGRLVQIQGMESGYYEQGSEPAAAEDGRAAGGARHDLRRGRADPGDDRGDIPGVGGPPADKRQAGGRAAAGRPARDAGRAAPGPPRAPHITAVRGARQGRVRR